MHGLTISFCLESVYGGLNCDTAMPGNTQYMYSVCDFFSRLTFGLHKDAAQQFRWRVLYSDWLFRKRYLLETLRSGGWL